MKKNLLYLCVLLCVSYGYSQGQTSSPVFMKSGTQFYPNNINEFVSENAKESTVQNRYYKYVQFNSIPSQQEKLVMEGSGLKFLEYIPKNTYLVSFPKNFSKSNLLSYGVRSVIELKNQDRITDLAIKLPYPEWATAEGNVMLYLSFYEDLNFNSCILNLGEEILYIRTENKHVNKVLVSVNESNVYELLNNPSIRLIDLMPEPGKPEGDAARNMHRSKQINTRAKIGRKYDGSGVVVVDNDDGIVGPHIDFTGRMTQPGVTSDLGDHGDMTAGIIGGYGNLDPTMGGMAPGCELIIQQYRSTLPNTVTLHTVDSAVIFSSSYSNGTNAGYTTLARQVDREIRQNPNMIQVFSAGNANGNRDWGYGAGAQWGNITGGHKAAKNVIATANLFSNMSLIGSSSRGPAEDGRTKPDISANGNGNMTTGENNTYRVGGGTSAACPSISGVMAQMYHAYKTKNGVTPESGLMKAIILNTAEDFGNVGPDFKYGWGRVDALRSIEAIETNRYLSSTISNGVSNTHPIVVPSNVKEVKVMVYWHDYEASTASTTALVNDLDAKLELGSLSFSPWTLDPAKKAADSTQALKIATLNLPATKGIDTLNNVEQISIVNPASGTYTLRVAGTSVPQGPQKYFVTYEYIYDEIRLSNPQGGEGFVPGVTERIFWDAVGNTGNFTLSYSIDSGATWSSIGTSAGSARYRDWTVPSRATAKALVKIERGSLSAVSPHTFSIINRPTNLRVVKVCPNYMEVAWNGAVGADEYQVYLLGDKYMDSVGRTTGTTFQIPIANSQQEQWFSVASIKTNNQGNRGRRQIAEYYPGGLLNCTLTLDASVSSFVSPSSSSCISGLSDIIIRVENTGSSSISNIPVKYQINGGSVISETITSTIAPSAFLDYTFTTQYNFASQGNYTLRAWSELPGELYPFNDSTGSDYTYSPTLTIPFIENFNSFSNCSTDPDCETINCGLRNGFVNLTNFVEDDIDWRTNNGATPSNGTGPAGDHTTGSTRYLYIEASGTCDSKTASLLSPCIDISKSIAYPAVQFWYHMTGTAVDSLSVDIFDGTIWHLDQFKVGGDQGSQWRKAIVYVTAFSGKTIKVRINATTGTGWSSDIAIDDFGIDDHVSIEENDLNKYISIYPNPSAGEFNMSISDPNISKANIEVFDMYGRLILTKNMNSSTNTFDLSEFATGVYTVKINANNQITTQRIVKK
ncbi:MAG: S8 family serine peptidase [Flavobacteriales bacterium]